MRDHHSDNFLPDFCSREALFLVLLIAALLCILLALAGGGTLDEMLAQFALQALFVTWIALIDVALLCQLRRWQEQLQRRLHPGLLGALAFALLQLVTLAFTLITDWLADWQMPGWPQDWLAHNLLPNLAISAIVTAIALRYFYIAHQWRLGVQAEERARFAALQARIRPHFLFNSLNSVASLTHVDPQAAEDAVLDLAELFRASLGQRQSLSLGEELALAKSYLRIEAQRLGERLQVAWELPDPLPDIQLPALTLQPLLENGVYHGIEPRAGGGLLRISAAQRGGALHIEIANPLPEGLAEGETTHRAGNRMALDNVRQRLQLAFGERAALETDARRDQYVARLRLPLKN